MNTSKLFFSGVPTGPDVDKLEKEYGVPVAGAMITYDAITRTIGSDHRDHRFRTVTAAWRKRLERDHRVLLEAIPCEGFRAMTPDILAESQVKEFSGHIKGQRKAVYRVGYVTGAQLTPENAKKQAHLISVGNAVRLALETSAKKIDYSKAIK